MNEGERHDVEESLRRIEQLVSALDAGRDGAARAAARELLEAVLDLHGIALARIAKRLSANDEGRRMYATLGGDEHVKAVLLLHGLHPETAEERIRTAAAALERETGAAIALLSVNDGVARLRVDSGPREWNSLCREIGGRLIEAAPDVDDIAIERAPVSGVMLAAAAG